MPATPAERKRKERQSRREAGLVRVELWTTPEKEALIRAIQQMPTYEDVVHYLNRWLKKRGQ